MNETDTSLLVSVVIVNYNCKAWVARCLESLREQTIYDRIEVIFTDNISRDGSDLQAQELMKDWPHGVFVQTGANLGFGGGANRGAAVDNPKGGDQVVELRSSDSKRFYTHRNHLLTLLKSPQHFLLLLLLPATALALLEGLAGAVW